MADTLRIKRRTGGGAGAPSSLANAELAYNEVDHTLYYGEGTGGGGGSATVIVPIGGAGLLNNAALTGTVTAPTPTPAADSSTKIATTAFVQGAIAAVSSGVTNVAVANGLSGGGTGAVTIGISAGGIANASLGSMAPHTFKGNNTGASAAPIDVTAAQLLADIGAAPLASPSFTGAPSTAATPASGDNSLKLATTAFVIGTRLDQLAAPSVDVAWNSKRITGLLDPSNPQDAATKNYVDNVSVGIDAKPSVRLATTANITLSGNVTIDGFTTAAGDRVLVKNQTTTAANGVYVAAAGAWARAFDMDIWAEFPGAFVFVEIGTANADTGWVCTVDQGGTLNTTSVTWTQFSGGGAITAGDGMTQSGNILNVVGTANRITVGVDSIDISTAYVGQNTITTLGTITTGAWQGTTIAVANGGSGAATLTGHIKGNGTGAFTATPTIPNTDISGLGTMSTQAASAVAITGGAIDGITFDCGTF